VERRRADATRSINRLTTTAREVFAERGHDAALDEIARRADVGNATLYRHFPTRGDLLVAVYAEEVRELADRGSGLLTAADPAAALLEWLDLFVEHVVTTRVLVPDESAGGRFFAEWHNTMIATAEALLRRAQEQAGVPQEVAVRDLLALAHGAALAGTDLTQSRRLLRLAWHGVY
jgi:AcrR family transcriptional regulator